MLSDPKGAESGKASGKHLSKPPGETNSKKAPASSPSQGPKVAAVVVNQPPNSMLNQSVSSISAENPAQIAQPTDKAFEISLPRLNPEESATFVANPQRDARLEV